MGMKKSKSMLIHYNKTTTGKPGKEIN